MLAQASGSTPAAESVNAAYHALLTLSQGLPDIAAEQTRARLTSLQAELQAVIVAGGNKSWNHAAFVCLLQYIASTPPPVVLEDPEQQLFITLAFSRSSAIALTPIRRCVPRDRLPAFHYNSCAPRCGPIPRSLPL